MRKTAIKKPSTTVKKSAGAASKAKTIPKKRAKPDSDDENENDDGSPASSHSGFTVTPPKKQKLSQPVKRVAGKPLVTVDNMSDGITPAKAKSKASKEASDKYQKLTQLEHIILRPDTYIGSTDKLDPRMWVFNSSTESMEFRTVQYVPGLFKLFDEILVNAADNKQRDKNMDTIRVDIDRENGEISVMNNGRGIPIQIHEKEKVYIPEMIFGQLLTSSNYNDEEEKTTGGRNGYGAKLANVFSTRFHLDTIDSKSKRRYQQTWRNNMKDCEPADISATKDQDYTIVSFTPDYRRFGMEGIDDDFDAILKRRVYDMAGILKGVKVYLNDKRVSVKGFESYTEMYVKAIAKERNHQEEQSIEPPKIITQSDGYRWQVGFAVSDGTFQQVSFVNSIATTQGGTHVNYIADQICDHLGEVVKKKRDKAGVPLKAAQIRNHIFIFVNAQIVNPSFSSQSKESLNTPKRNFGSEFLLSKKFLKEIQETEVVDNILHFAQQKADQAMKKTDGTKRSRIGNAKLVDANKAGSKEGWKCTLILTEGDSAKLLAVAGRSVVGADYYGVFPLRGKLLNVRDAAAEKIAKNSEIQNIKQFIGLKHKQGYTTTQGLRYGHIMIMTDQDHDGSHIKGLLINFLEHSFPSLLRLPGFLLEFITPIVKVYKGNPKQPKQQAAFFTMPEYENWKALHSTETGWEHKYYKGLGTSSTIDAQVYFRDLDRHLKKFHTMKEEESKLIDLAFSSKKADDRKEWLRQFRPGTYLDHSQDKISYDDFINKELILFSMADNMRSIPSVLDGLKPGQRKVLFSCFRRNLKKDLKVVELAGHVSGTTAYAHGEQSLQQTICGLAQTFVGSNNVNLLEPSGNFGSRLQGGADAASARYIYTRLTPFARKIFSSLDDPLLDYHLDDNKRIEPQFYMPVLPMVLVNGSDGIGTGWSSSIPNYDPEEIVENLRRMMRGEETKPMQPWFRGWTGELTANGDGKYTFHGRIEKTGKHEVQISELPIRVWTQDFKDKLEDIIKGEKAPSFIKDYADYNTENDVNFVIQLDDKQMAKAEAKGLEEMFKLTKSMSTSNMVAFDAEGRLHKYNSVNDIMIEFFNVRLKYYQKRKDYQLDDFSREHTRMSNQARFITMIVEGQLKIGKKAKSVLIAELKEKKFVPFPKTKDAQAAGEKELVVEEQEEDVEKDADAGAYDYLLGMAIWSLTLERVQKLQKQIGEKQAEIDALIKLSPKELWTSDLDAFIDEWRSELAEDARLRLKLAHDNKRASMAKGKAAGKGKRKRADNDDSDFDVKPAVFSSKLNGSSGAAAKLSSVLNGDAKPKAVKVLKQSNLKAVGKSVTNPTGPKKASASGLLTPSVLEDTDDFDDDALGQLASKPAVRKPVVKIDDDEDDDSLEAIVARPAAARPARKAGRAAAAKPVNYNLSSDSDAEMIDPDADMEDDNFPIEAISHAESAPPVRLDSSDSTLKRQGPSESADDDLLPITKLVKKAPSKPSSTIEKHAPAKPEVIARKPSSNAPGSGSVADAAQKTLSPMAKAYAKKRAERQASAVQKPSDEFDFDVDADDDNDVLPASPMAAKQKSKASTTAVSSKAQPTARPTRKVAAPVSKKSKYAVDEDSEQDFNMSSDSEPDYSENFADDD